MLAPSLMYVARRSIEDAGPTSPTTAWRYSIPSSKESGTPSSCISGLLGSHNTPPDMAVEPPTTSAFSMTSAWRSAAAATIAAHRPPPLPTTRRSLT